WMSAKSLFRPDKAIRGGVPICFPWFGPKADDPKAAQHGFARVSEWSVESQRAGAVSLKLESSDATRRLWPFDFVARQTVTAGRALRMEFAVTNRGREPFR